jgi:hypothetical protein
MKKSPSQPPARPAAPTRRGSAARSGDADLQPAATGANRGSPAASVMKQFAKTKAESGGRS